MLQPGGSKLKAKPQLRMNNNILLIILFVIICFGSFVIGYQIVAVTMLEKQFRDYNGISSQRSHYYLTLATAIMPLGAIIGCLVSRKLQLLGQYKLLIASDVVVVGSCLLMTRNLGVNNLCISRLLIGISCGISSSLIPPYLISLSPLEWRGLAGSLHQLLITIGVGFSIYLGQRLDQLTVFGITNWQSYLFLPVIYACVRIIVLSFFKFNSLESHYENGDTIKLRHFMKLFYSRVDVDELVSARRMTKEKQEVPSGCLGMQGKLLSVSVVLLAMNQLSGINIVLSYSKQLFMKVSYYDEARADNCMEVLAIAQVLATMVGGWLANKFGRKRMLVLGGQVVTMALFSVFIVYSFSPKSVMFLVSLIVVFILAYAATVGVIPLLYLGELFTSLSCINIIYWTFSLIGMLSSELMLTHLGVGKSFFIYGVVSYLCTFVLGTQMIESHNKTRKQLQNEYLFDHKDDSSVRQYSAMKSMDPTIINEAITNEENNSLFEMDQ